MKDRNEYITDLYKETLERIGKNKTEWMKFLSSAAYLYKLSLDEQVLVYAQKPHAKAVLEIERWNKDYFRWVNAGSKGIAVFDKDSPVQRIKYYFDVADTHPVKAGHPVPIWEMNEHYENILFSELSKKYKALVFTKDIFENFMKFTCFLTDKYISDYISELELVQDGSMLEEIDKQNRDILFKDMVNNSVIYMINYRCQVPCEIASESLRSIMYFDTREALQVLGSAVSDIAEIALSEIGKSIGKIQFSSKRHNYTFAQENNVYYNESKQERSHVYEISLHEKRRLSIAKSDASGAKRATAWKICYPPMEVSEGQPKDLIHEPTDKRRTERTLNDDRKTSIGGGRAADSKNGGEFKSQRRIETARHDEMGGTHEQSETGGGGNNTQSNHLSVKKQAGKDTPAILNAEEIYMILKYDKFKKHKNKELYFFLKNHPNREEQIAYIKEAFNTEFTELLDENKQRYGYYISNDSLQMWKGSYMQPEAGMEVSIDVVREFYHQLIEEHRLIDAPVKPLPSLREQMSLFDLSPAEETKERKVSYKIPTDVVEMILLDDTEPNSFKDKIAIFFSIERSKKESEEFLYHHYLKSYVFGGKGFQLTKGKKVAVWLEKQGLRLAYGETSARAFQWELITWETITQMIRLMIKENRFLPQEAVNELYDKEAKEVSSYIWELKRNTVDPSYLSTLNDIQTLYPDCLAKTKEKVQQDDSFQKIYHEIEELEKAHKDNTALIRFSIYNPQTALKKMKEYKKAHLEINGQHYKKPQLSFFITQDEITHVVCDEHQRYAKFEILSYFVAETDFSKRQKKIMEIWGTGGRSSAGYQVWFDSKGFSIKRTYHETKKEIVLSWKDVTKRIEQAIQNKTYLSLSEQKQMEEYDRYKIANRIRSFFNSSNVKDNYIHPFSNVQGFNSSKEIEQIMEMLKYDYTTRHILELIHTIGLKINHPEQRQLLNDMQLFYQGDFSAFRRNAHTEIKHKLNDITEKESLAICLNECMHRHMPAHEYELTYGNKKDGEETILEMLDGLETTSELILRLNEVLESDEAVYVLREEVSQYFIKLLAHKGYKSINVDKSLTRYMNGDIVCFEHENEKQYAIIELLEKSVVAYTGNGSYLTFQKEAFDRLIAKNKWNDYTYIADRPMLHRARHYFEDMKVVESEQDQPSFTKKEIVNYRAKEQEEKTFSPKKSFSRNIEALRILKLLKQENRQATKEEQRALFGYMGWGGLASAFDERKHKESWKKENQILRELLTDKEYESARASTLTAFYTPNRIITAIYQVLINSGMKQGNILEPSCGTGKFFAFLPAELKNCKLYGVEIDELSGRIAQYLYPHAEIQICPFEKTIFSANSFSAVIGNVPFGNFHLLDERYKQYNFHAHEYFFARAVDSLKQGGILAMVTSHYFLDTNGEIKEYLNDRADFIGAIRLPNTAFQDTEVISDIVFFQKRADERKGNKEWMEIAKREDGVQMNAYFIQHPEMVIGTAAMGKDMYGKEDLLVKLSSEQNFEELLSSAIQKIKIKFPEEKEIQEEAEEVSFSLPSNEKNADYSYVLIDDKIYYQEGNQLLPQKVSETTAGRIKGMIAIRDVLRLLIRYENENVPAHIISAARERLNIEYDRFVIKYGRINTRGNTSAFREDSSFYLLCSLEYFDSEKNFIKKADIFDRRTIRPVKAIGKVSTPSEALSISMAEKGYVDIAYMKSLLEGTYSAEAIVRELKGIIFKPPAAAKDIYSGWQTADEYFSGNVRKKLKEAQKACEEDEEFEINVKALEKVQPKDLKATEIGIQMGAVWVPEDVYQQFLYEIMEADAHCRNSIQVKYSDLLKCWTVTNKTADRGNLNAERKYGTKRINGYKIFESTLNMRVVCIYDNIEDHEGNKKREINPVETAIAQEKQELIKNAFEEWIWKDSDRRERLVSLYNEKFNNIRLRTYDGSHLRFYGMNQEIQLRPHQYNAVARAIYGGNVLLGHEVGAGKTFTMIAIAMEKKRLGLATKAMFVVPNNIVGDFAKDFLRLYPNANILVPTPRDFEKKNRKRFCAKIATGQYDGIILAHSQFGKIPISIERQEKLLRQQIDMTIAAIKSSNEEEESYTVKQLERTKISLNEKLLKLHDRSKKDDLLSFEELGVDLLLVDEADMFKNLFCASKLNISQSDSQKASDLFAKTRYLDELTNYKGVVFATGTCVSNSIVEVYTMQRYLQYNLLQEYGVEHIDEWIGQFAVAVTAMELTPEGNGFQMKTRFSSFHNLPELMQMFWMNADIKTAEDLNLPVPEKVTIIEKTLPSEFQQEMLKTLGVRAEKIRKKQVKRGKGADNMLLITGDGKKLALDQRMLNPMLPDDPASKVNKCVENVFEIWQKHMERRLTQIIFCDLGTPNGNAVFNVYEDIRGKLVAKGVPFQEIAFIHDAKNDNQKLQMIEKVRIGQIRVLLGSTQKLGAGTNCQNLLIAVHDLDTPWRPRDLQQRHGRIIRQGNENKKAHIYTYITERTFDSYLFQMLERKQSFISKVLTNKSPVRAVEEIDEAVLSFKEAKALASGDPRIMEFFTLETEVQKLETVYKAYMNQQYELQDNINKHYPIIIKKTRTALQEITEDKKFLEQKQKERSKDFPGITIKGIVYDDKKLGGEKLIEAVKMIGSGEPKEIGEYFGFSLLSYFDATFAEYKIIMKHMHQYEFSVGSDPFGNFRRMDNLLASFDKLTENELATLHKYEKMLEVAQREVQVPFSKKSELEEKRKQYRKLSKILKLNKDVKEENVQQVIDAEYRER